MTNISAFKDAIKKIQEIFTQKENEMQWLSSLIEKYNNDSPAIEIFDQIVNKLLSYKDEECTKLANDINKVNKDEDTLSDILYIFFASEEEEEDEIPIIIDDEDLNGTENRDLHDPKIYFHNYIQKLQDVLGISSDLSYLLLKAYNWDSDEIIRQWLNSKEKLMKNLEIDLNRFLNSPKKPLSFEPIERKDDDDDDDTKECLLCCEEDNLVRLYCGHIICADCLKKEIIEQLSKGCLPFCRLARKPDSNAFHAEISPSDIEKVIDDHSILSIYENLKEKSEVDTCRSVKECQYCNTLITRSEDR